MTSNEAQLPILISKVLLKDKKDKKKKKDQCLEPKNIPY